MSFTITGTVRDLDGDPPEGARLVCQSLLPWTEGRDGILSGPAGGVISETGSVEKDTGGPWVIDAPEGTPLWLRCTGLPSVRFAAPEDGATVTLRDLYADHSPVPAPSPLAPYVRGVGVESITDPDGDGTATVTLTDGSTSPLPLPRGLRGETGPRGPRGEQGLKGDPGADGTTTTIVDHGDGTATITTTGA